MVYQYIAMKDDGTMVKGTLSAINEENATSLLDYAGYRVINLKIFAPLFSIGTLKSRFSKAKPTEIILFYRQMALLLDSGMDIISSLEILRSQVDKYVWKNVLGEIITDLRSGNPLSVAMEKHPNVFSALARQSIRVGEQAGGLEAILRQVADYLQKEQNATKGIKSALTYPIIALIAAIAVVIVMIGFVLPSFSSLYSGFGAKLPTLTRDMIAFGQWFRHYMLYLGVIVVAVFLATTVYVRTKPGRLQKDVLMLKIPVIGKITHLKELSRCCRSTALLFNAGLPLTEVLPLVIGSLTNKAIIGALQKVHENMLKGEGLARPMSGNPLFLPMMTQMVKVGEETGNLDVTLTAVADSYETEAKDRTDALIAMIQPTMTIVIGGIVGLIALSMVSAMYSIYGQAF
ncbi:MAG TPA: type II secretion system F family protein [Dehalococcoidales bacterium]|nr:type II secretion system F family protein [Dehalococcoidales bacterium]